MKKNYYFALIVALLTIQSCGLIGNKENDKSINSIEALQSKVIDHGNGVFYFNNIRSSFGNTLSNFIKTHPNLELVSIAGNGTGASGVELGYFVVFKDITKK
jgi:hypothetical protein